MPEPAKVAQTIAKAHGETIQVHGAEAARLLGLTTQMPLQSVFYTSGPNRELKIGKLQLILKHIAPRKLALSGRPSGLALSALWYLGKERVSSRTIKTIREKLGPEAFEEFRAETRSMPSPKGKECHPCARYKLSPMCRAAHQSRAIRMNLISYPCYRSTAKKQLVPRMTASRPAIRTNSSRPQLFLLQR